MDALHALAARNRRLRAIEGEISRQLGGIFSCKSDFCRRSFCVVAQSLRR